MCFSTSLKGILVNSNSQVSVGPRLKYWGLFRWKSHACEEPGDSGLDSTAEAPHCQWISDALFAITGKEFASRKDWKPPPTIYFKHGDCMKKTTEFWGQVMLINSNTSVQGTPQQFKNYLSLCLISNTVDRIWSDIQSSAHLFFFTLSRYVHTCALDNFVLKHSCALFWD